MALLDRTKKENAPFSRGSAGTGESYNFYRQTTLALTCKAEQWAAALGVADQELRRALAHGFLPAELTEVAANYRNYLEESAKTASTRRSEGLAEEITQQLLDRDVFTTPADDLALLGPALDKITVADCLAALRLAWSPPHRLILVTGNAKLGDAAAATIAAAMAARARSLEGAGPARSVGRVRARESEGTEPGLPPHP